MDTVSYPDANVAEFIEQSLVPLRVRFDAQPLSSQFNLTWTPTLILLDAAGKEHHRTVGFLAPEELIPSLILGVGKCHFELGEFAEATQAFDRVLAQYPKSNAAPEAVFVRGVCGYKSTHDAKPLKQAYERLKAQYPVSEWTKRAYPYRLL